MVQLDRTRESAVAAVCWGVNDSQLCRYRCAGCCTLLQNFGMECLTHIAAGLVARPWRALAAFYAGRTPQTSSNITPRFSIVVKGSMSTKTNRKLLKTRVSPIVATETSMKHHNEIKFEADTGEKRGEYRVPRLKAAPAYQVANIDL